MKSGATKGAVTWAGGTAPEEIEVILLRFQAILGEIGSWDPVTSTIAEANDSYELRGLRPGAKYTVGAYGNDIDGNRTHARVQF